MTQLILNETYDIDKVKSILSDNEIINKTSNPAMVKKFLQKIIHNNGNIEVKYGYSKNSENPSGRLYAKGGIQNIPKEIRNYLLSDGDFFDIDINNCACAIIYNLCLNHKIKNKYFKTIQKVIDSKEEIIKKYYGGSKTDFKNAITPLYFNSDEVKYKNDFEKDFHTDILNIQKKLSKIEEYAEFKNEGPNSKGKMLCSIVYNWENRLIMECVQKIEDDTGNKPFALIHDGFILEQKYDLDKLENYIKQEFKFDIKFSYKPIENSLKIKTTETKYIMDYHLILDKHILEIADVIKPEITKIISYNDELKKYYVFNEQKGIWDISADPDEILARFLRKYTKQAIDDHIDSKPASDDKSVLKKWNKELKNINKCNAIIDTASFMSKLKDYLKRMLLDNDFCKKFNKNLYQIAFQNGLFDLRTKTLRPTLNYDDFICNPLKFDYQAPDENDKQRVRDIIFKICNCNQEHMDYYLSILGYALTGDAEKEKAIWYFVGVGGNNGKTLIMDALKSICPAYVCMMDTKGLTENCQNRHKHLNILSLSPRIIYLEELPKKGNIDTQIMKCLADGKSITVEKMFGNTSEYDVLAKLFTLSNHTPTFDNDGGTANRYRQCQFNSEFHTKYETDNFETLKFTADTTLADILKGELKMALLDLLFDYSQQFYLEGKLKPMPAEWQEITKNTIEDNSALESYIKDNCEFGSLYKLTRDEAEDICKILHIQFNHFKDEMSKLSNVRYDKNARSGSRRGVFVGIKRIDPYQECFDEN